MVMSPAVEDLLKEAIKREDEAFMEYDKMAENAAKSNIRWFLTSFSRARKVIRDKLTQIAEEKVDEEFGYPEEKILHIQATEHLNFEGEVDEGSLQSVLLFISKKESEDLDYFRELVESVSDGDVAKLLKPVLAEKEVILTKADRLYHDMIET